VTIYLQTETDLISYELGDDINPPTKVLFLVSDAQLSDVDRRFTLEYAYEYAQPVGNTEDIQLPFVVELENKFYYSLPWRTIQLIDETLPGTGGETPTPSPSPTTTITPTFFEEEPLGEYIYDSMEATSITGGSDGNSVVGYNDRSLTTIQGVNGVTGLSLDNNVVTLTETGRYYLKARGDAWKPRYVNTSINFISGDYAGDVFDGPQRWADDSAKDLIVTENSVVVDITQPTSLKVQTKVTIGQTFGLGHGGATLFVQKLANADGGGSSSGVEIGNADVFKDKSNFNGTLPSVIYTTYQTFMFALTLTDIDENPVTNAPTGRIYYRFPYSNNDGGWWLEFSNNSDGTVMSAYGVSHQSVNGTQLSSLQEYIDNGYATFLGSGGGGSSLSNGSSTFSSLTDTPSELSAGKYIKVNDEGNGIEFVDAPSGDSSSSGGSSSGGSSNFYGANIFLTQGTLAIKSQTSDFIESIIMVGNTNNFDITFKDGIFTEPPIMVSTAVNTSDNYLEGVLVKSDASSGDLYASGKKMTIRWELTSAIRSYMTTAIDGVGANLVFMKTGADFDAGSSSGGSPAGSGGGSSGGAGSLQVIKDKSNFYTDLPDAIVWPHSPVSTEAADRSEAILHLKYVHEPHPTNGVAIDIFYECRDVNQGGVFLGFGFNNNSNGDYAHLYSSIAHFQDIPSATNSLKWFIENNRAIYYGGGSGSTSTFSLSNKTKEVLVDTSTTSITESSEETSSGFSNPPYKVFHNGYEFFLVSHTQDYIKYQGLDADDLIHTIFFENDEMGTLKSVSDDNNTVFFVGVSDLKIMIDNGNCEYLDSQ